MIRVFDLIEFEVSRRIARKQVATWIGTISSYLLGYFSLLLMVKWIWLRRTWKRCSREEMQQRNPLCVSECFTWRVFLVNYCPFNLEYFRSWKCFKRSLKWVLARVVLSHILIEASDKSCRIVRVTRQYKSAHEYY